jgi:hypothetical protein
MGDEALAPASGRGDERTASGWTAWGLLILGKCALEFFGRWIYRRAGTSGAAFKTA